jgi:hypothetical protein
MNRVGMRIFLDLAAIVTVRRKVLQGTRTRRCPDTPFTRPGTRAREQRGSPLQQCSKLHTPPIRTSGIIAKK